MHLIFHIEGRIDCARNQNSSSHMDILPYSGTVSNLSSYYERIVLYYESYCSEKQTVNLFLYRGLSGCVDGSVV